MVEALVMADVLTKGVANTNPVKFVLGDLNSSSTGVTGPTGVGELSLYEILTGTPNAPSVTTSGSMPIYGGSTLAGGSTISGASGYGTAIDQLIANFTANWGDMAIKSIVYPVGFKVFNKMARRPKAMFNKMLRDAQLGGVVQL